MPNNPLSFTQAEVLPPTVQRGRRLLRKGGHWFDDENLDLISHVLDDWFRIPFTHIRFGLDGIIGLIPGVGDMAGGVASLVMLAAGWVRGVPYVGLVRMVANIAISVIVGAVPILGDMFDIGWKANRRNYKLLTRHLAQPRKHTWKDWAFLGVLALVLVAVFMAPLVLLLLALNWLRHRAVV